VKTELKMLLAPRIMGLLVTMLIRNWRPLDFTKGPVDIFLRVFKTLKTLPR
jgi:hypothetical protein